MRKLMIGYVCLWIVLTATMAFAERDGTPQCDRGHEWEHPALGTNAVVLWNAVADNSIAVIGASRHSRALLRAQLFRSRCTTQ